jgi:hypothetical protein
MKKNPDRFQSSSRSIPVDVAIHGGHLSPDQSGAGSQLVHRHCILRSSYWAELSVRSSNLSSCARMLVASPENFHQLSLGHLVAIAWVIAHSFSLVATDGLNT